MNSLLSVILRRLKLVEAEEETEKPKREAMHGRHAPPPAAPNSVVFIMLRRMRAPLLVLILSYAIAVLGMTLMPGVDAEGRPTPGMSIFHAFYFISYTATTIGFGELPHAFSDAQRAWATVSIYLTVIAWVYGIGNILTLVQDPDMRREIRAGRFRRQVGRLRQPFYLICGCGETGSLLLRALDARNQQAVVMDIDTARINALELGQYHIDTPALVADARRPESLIDAGLFSPYCTAVIALTNDDQANLAVAMTVKLLRPRLPVLCRADTLEVAANMASFGSNQIINPFEVFGEHLAMALNSPGQYLLYEWLTGVPGTPLIQPLKAPAGKWLVCGYGRFGKAVVRNLQWEGLKLTIVEAEPEKTGCPNCIRGSGTEADTLLAAGITEATGIVCGTDHDINNLSIAMTARQLNPGLFIVVRQNRDSNLSLFQHFDAHITMQPSRIIAQEFFSLLTTPLHSRFLSLARNQGDAWAYELISRIIGLVSDTVPEIWDLRLSRRQIGIWQLLHEGWQINLGELLREPPDRETRLPCVPLLLSREKEEWLLPDDATILQPGDRILFCARPGTRSRLIKVLRDRNLLTYVLTGLDVPGGTVWRWLHKRQRQAAAMAPKIEQAP
ncbi:Trk K+ transport system NAD-binding subunit [Sulfuritortus calidifontis]|uniref:Trk K+ transport system NAD-binding subunit n=1 Tax=Sulfuritortus calidifontis TaxID=1914471 RepID=A0A4R3K0N5_9PROT|nr:NAD-binding protein [Sulfuritortus calidifontis]TCS73809.1 Trk K+ transport system NAD-binding subunit [Sulfuritortus calidifontis]